MDCTYKVVYKEVFFGREGNRWVVVSKLYGDKKKRRALASSSASLCGGYLLSHLRSTIGVTGLNFSVRNG